MVVGNTTRYCCYNTSKNKWLELVGKPASDTRPFYYNGDEQTYVIAESDCYTVTGNKQTGAGNYTVTVTLKDGYIWMDDGTTNPVEYSFNIAKADIDVRADDKEIKRGWQIPELTFTITGLKGSDTAEAVAAEAGITIGIAANIDTGVVSNHDIVVSGSTATANYNVEYHGGALLILEKGFQTLSCQDMTLTYGDTGKKLVATTTGDSIITYDVVQGDDVISVDAQGNITVLKAGYATVEVTAPETADYNVDSKRAYITVAKKQITAPTAPTTPYTYNGGELTYPLATSDCYEITGNKQTNAGTYPVTIALTDPANTKWADGTTIGKTYTFTIEKAPLTITADSKTIKVGSPLPTYTYTPSGLKGADTVDSIGANVTIGCSGADNMKIGTYDIVVSGKAETDNYKPINYVSGVLTVTAKDVQTITASDVTLTYGDTNGKITATTNGDGAISYAVTTGADVISVDTNGNITALKAGTATVTITAAETANYAKAVKTITVTVKAVETQPSVTQPPVTQPPVGPSYTGTRPPVVTTTTTTTTTPETSESSDSTLVPPEDDDEVIDEDIYEDDDSDDYIEPQIKGDNGKMGWETIEDEISEASDGEKIVVDMNGATEVPEEIFEQIAGQDIDLVIELDNGFTWTINGESVTEPMNIDLGVNEGNTIPVKVINNITGENYYMSLTLTHNGEFGFTATLTVDMDDENADCFANLYWYTDGKLKFMSADKIDAKGKADLTFTHASEYVIVVDDYDHGKTAEDVSGASDKSDDADDEDYNPFTAVTISFTGVIISAAAVVISRKRKQK